MLVPARTLFWLANDAVICSCYVSRPARPHDIAQPIFVASVERCRTADKLVRNSFLAQPAEPIAVASRPPRTHSVQGNWKRCLLTTHLTGDGHVGKTYTLTGPEALSNAEIAHILSDKLGREIRYVDLAPEQMKQALLSAGLPEWNTDALLDLQRLYREGKAAAVTKDVEQLLGRKPISFAQFASDYRDAFEAQRRAAT